MSIHTENFQADITQASEWYGDTTNTTGVPLIDHSIEVAQILENVQHELLEFTDDEFLISVRSALAHDVLEDTDVSADTIATIWGQAVLRTIIELSNKKGDSDFNEYIEFLCSTASDVTRVVKLADILANVRNSIRQFESIKRSWLVEFWIPLLLRYEVTVLQAKNVSFPQMAEMLRSEVQEGIRLLQRKIDERKQE